MAGSVYTFQSDGFSGQKVGAVEASQGTVPLGSSGLFLPSEYQAAISDGLILVAGPAASPSPQLTAPTVAASGTAGLPNGVYKCAVTFVTAAGETMIGAEATVTVSSHQISWSNIPVGTAASGVTARKLYRTAAAGASGSEKLVTTISDNTTTTYTDNVADGSLGAACPTSDTAGVVGPAAAVVTGPDYALLSGNPADDAYAVGSGTGAKVSISGATVTKAAVIATGLAPADIGAATTASVTAAAVAGMPAITATPVTVAGALPIGQHTPVDATAGALTMTLPTGQTQGTRLSSEKYDSTTNAVTLSGNIRGVASSTLTLKLQHETILLEVDANGSWWPYTGHKTLSSLDARYPPLGQTGPNLLDGMYHLSSYVTDFTGATDQTSNFQAAVTDAAAAYVSSGNPQTIYWDKQGSVQVTSVTWQSGVSLRSPHYSLAKVVGTSQTAPAISAATATYAAPIVDVQIEGVEFDGSQATLPGSYNVLQKGISLFPNGRNVAVRRCYVHDFGATGIATDSSTDGCHVQDNLVVNCGRGAATAFTVTSISGAVATVSTNPVTAGVVAGMPVGNFAGGLSYPGYTASGNYPIKVSSVSSTTITLSVAPTGTSGTLTVAVLAVNGGGSGIGIGTDESTSKGTTTKVPIGGSTQWSQEPQIISGNVVIGCCNYGIFHESQANASASVGGGVIVSNNICVGNGASGIGLAGTLGQICQGNTTIANYKYGIGVDYGTLARNSSRDSLISGNMAIGNIIANYGFDMANLQSPGTGTITQFGRHSLIGNTSLLGGVGILVQMGNTNTTQPIRIADNTVSLASGAGIQVAYYTGAGGTATASNVEITRNLVYTNCQSTTGAGVIVNVPLVNSFIDDNKVFNSASNTTQTYGLQVTQTFTGGSVRDNYFSGATGGMTGATVTNMSATTWVARNWGSAAPANAAVSVTASPMTYTAPSFPSNLAIVGGTVSAVTVGGVAMPTAGVIPLEPLDSVVITYSAAPTLATRAR